MLKSTLRLAAVATVLVLGSAGAFAQENPYTKAPPPTPMSSLHQQAQLNHDPDACVRAVDKMQDNVGLRIHGDDGKNTRMYVNTLLDTARNAARAGDDEACWHWYDKASNRL
ncbi:MAG TPA: hypothetical protein VGB82_14585 [Alphaproteobacteria bacterium]